MTYKWKIKGPLNAAVPLKSQENNLAGRDRSEYKIAEKFIFIESGRDIIVNQDHDLALFAFEHGYQAELGVQLVELFHFPEGGLGSRHFNLHVRLQIQDKVFPFAV